MTKSHQEQNGRVEFLPKQAFDAVAVGFDQRLDTEDAWQHLDNWQFERPLRGNYDRYEYNEEEKMQAAADLAAAHQELQAAFAALDGAEQRRLVARPIIVFEAEEDREHEAPSMSFEFNLPEIVAGHRAWCRLDEYDFRTRQAVRAGREEIDLNEYGRLHFESKTLFHDSVSQAARFVTCGFRRLYGDSVVKQHVLDRARQIEGRLSAIYLDALGHGDEGTRSVLHEWLSRVNSLILAVCKTEEGIQEIFGPYKHLYHNPGIHWVRMIYSHEGDLIPIGHDMVRGKNARWNEHEHYIANY